ncbi:hypothetical protein EXIGLDRAFT_494719 [Exidia glandulosa HHB12029]|uniref:Uncharacterized protein n=1 Tax=Exidia glandulosa HHB12029 TaxID=1314781 RepID=A0A165JKF4_EXIGL|nr:hypothetical protein EXIGLDRAFT_494719 [Exidia glandulosa HHB12029]
MVTWRRTSLTPRANAREGRLRDRWRYSVDSCATLSPPAAGAVTRLVSTSGRRTCGRKQIIMRQIARERRASVGNDAHDARPQLLERRASGLQRQREDAEARERQIAQERGDACRMEAAIVDAARKREAAAVERHRAEVQAAARLSKSSARTPQRHIPLPMATVQSDTETDDDEAQEDEDSSSSEEEPLPHSSTGRARSRNPTLDSPPPAPVHPRPHTTRQVPKIERKGEPPPITRYNSDSPSTTTVPPKPRPPEEGLEDKPIPHEREHQSFVNGRRDDERMRKEREFARRAEEAKNRYQERKRAEDEEKERERGRRIGRRGVLQLRRTW